MDKQKQFGQRVRAYRRGRNMRQVELAALVNTRQAQISAIENGKVDIPLSMVERLASALGVDALRLMRDEVA